jgi:hypothetical protein
VNAVRVAGGDGDEAVGFVLGDQGVGGEDGAGGGVVAGDADGEVVPLADGGENAAPLELVAEDAVAQDRAAAAELERAVTLGGRRARS